MQRLIKDASQMTDIQKELGITVDGTDMSFANQVKAIQVIQRNMGIMGTTAMEASGTIQGATGSMKSAWENLVGGMADETADMQQLVSDFMGTLITEDGQGGVIGTIVPRISTVIEGIGNAMQTLLPQLMGAIAPVIEQNISVIVSAFGKISSSILATLPQIIPAVANLVTQIGSALISGMPKLLLVGVRMVLALADGFRDTVPQMIQLIPDMLTDIVEIISEWFPDIVESGVGLITALVNGFMKALPKLVDYIPTIVDTIASVISNNLPKITDSAVKIIQTIIKGIVDNLPKLIASVPKIITTITSVLIKNLPVILKAGVQILTSLISGIGSMIGALGRKAGEIASTILDKVRELPHKVISVGTNLVRGIWSGISNGLGWIKSKISGWVGNVLSFIKRVFGINSPSKVMEDEVGVFLAQGIGVGFSDEMRNVSAQMAESIPTSFDVNASVNGIASEQPSMVEQFKQALSEMKIELDDEVAGRFVDRTVTRLIYA